MSWEDRPPEERGGRPELPPIEGEKWLLDLERRGRLWRRMGRSVGHHLAAFLIALFIVIGLPILYHWVTTGGWLLW